MSQDDPAWKAYLKRVNPLKRKDKTVETSLKPLPVPKASRALPPLPDFVGKGEVPLQKVPRSALKRVQLEGRLDLHGFTQAQAHEALLSFLHHAFAQGKKQVLIVTGKGAIGNPDTLKKLLPRWCEEAPFTYMVKGLSLAKPEHGGSGAYYVFLRSQRSGRQG